MRPAERHRHVEIVHTRGERGVEDGHDETRVHGVEHVGDRVLADQRHHPVHVGRVHAGAGEAVVSADLRQRPLHSTEVVVSDDDVPF